jgi:type IV pilus assembly protein PilC
VLPAAACRLLALGQRSGTGDAVMEEVARRLTQESELAVEARVSRVEPTLVLVTSLLVGAILLSVMLPLMNIMAAIG